MKRPPSRPKTLLHNSNFRPLKRVDDAVRVLFEVRKRVPNAELVLVGDGPTRAPVEKLVRELRLTDVVHFRGEQNDLTGVLQKSDVFIFPSETESFGLAALEALACGVPVVASRTGGLPELIDDGETGFLQPVGDIAAMAASTVKLLTDEHLWARLSSAARAVAQTRWRCEPQVDLYEATYRRVLSKKEPDAQPDGNRHDRDGWRRRQPSPAPRWHSGAEVLRDLKKVSVLGTVLYVAAHPDDENTRLLATLANETQVRTAYLAFTRGEGGQNLIGQELGPLLGMIRTQELLAARRLDGAEQYFTRSRDFGFSKSVDETLRIWDHDARARPTPCGSFARCAPMSSSRAFRRRRAIRTGTTRRRRGSPSRRSAGRSRCPAFHPEQLDRGAVAGEAHRVERVVASTPNVKLDLDGTRAHAPGLERRVQPAARAHLRRARRRQPQHAQEPGLSWRRSRCTAPRHRRTSCPSRSDPCGEVAVRRRRPHLGAGAGLARGGEAAQAGDRWVPRRQAASVHPRLAASPRGDAEAA